VQILNQKRKFISSGLTSPFLIIAEVRPKSLNMSASESSTMDMAASPYARGEIRFGSIAVFAALISTANSRRAKSAQGPLSALRRISSIFTGIFTSSTAKKAEHNNPLAILCRTPAALFGCRQEKAALLADRTAVRRAQGDPFPDDLGLIMHHQIVRPHTEGWPAVLQPETLNRWGVPWTMPVSSIKPR
jgi:hypothetical protein